MTDVHGRCGEEQLQAALFKKSCELFSACDVEKKGYISKQDMPRLEEKLGLELPPDQLNFVFDMLDKDGNGYLTLEEFTDGFGNYLGVTSSFALDDKSSSRDDLTTEIDYEHDQVSKLSKDRARENYHGTPASNENSWDIDQVTPASNERVYENVDDVANDDEHFNDLLGHIGATDVLQEVEGVKAMWGQLRRDQPELLTTFEDFLQRITGELKRTHREYKSLETILRSKSISHDEEVRKLYEEMETQINIEKQRVINEEKAKERQLKEEMERELREKDKQLQDLLSHHYEMEKKLQELNSQETESKQENEKLQKQKDELEDTLSESRRHLEESRSYISQLRTQQKEEKKERALAALHVTEGIALERESLVKQLDLLRDINRKLRDDKDEAELRRMGGEDGDYTRLTGGLPRSSSVQTSNSHGRHRGTGGFSAQHSFTSFGGPGGGKDMAPGERSVADQQDLLFRRSQFTKQGSILSNYITEPTWRPHTYESDLEADEDGIECDDDGDVMMIGMSRDNSKQSVDESRPHRPAPPRSPRPFSRMRGEGENNTDDDDVGVVCSGLDTDEDELDDVRRSSTNRKPRRQTAISVEEGRGEKSYASSVSLLREQPLGANSSPESTDTGSRTAAEIDSNPPERVFKVVFVGDSGVGKSSFIHRFCSNGFKAAFQATIDARTVRKKVAESNDAHESRYSGVDFQVKNLWVDRHIIALQLWDTAGQERFRSITKQYFRKADGVLLMYDVSSEESFRNVRNWMNSVQEGTDDGTVLVLAGNKMDLINEDDKNRAVQTKDGARLAEEFGCLFYETSAKSGLMVPESIEAMARLLREREDKEMEKALHLSELESKKRVCCK